LHVALIPDGNGRWAERRGLPRSAGHRAGAEVVGRIVEAAARAGLATLTLYVFAQYNWGRPAAEVARLMQLFLAFLRGHTATVAEHGGRLTVLGRRDRLSAELREAIEAAEAATRGGANLHLRLAIDYSSRETLAAAARCFDGGSAAEFARLVAGGAPAVDFLIRTGGELRLSDFLLWECAYAELYFTPTLWPDFTVAEFENALEDFRRRQRRFGRLPAAAAARKGGNDGLRP
jgi:undecaprenyl diphosphate synthase